MKRIVILIGIFSSNVAQITIYNHSPNIAFFTCLISLVFVFVAFCFIFTTKSIVLQNGITICDSILFGCALTWIILTAATSAPDPEKTGFIIANAVLAVGLLITDFQARKSLESATSATQRHEPSEERVGTFVECAGGMCMGGSEKKDVEPIEFRESYLYDGFRVRMSRLHGTDPMTPKNLEWRDFTDIEHKVTSSSCHIYSARWNAAPVILKIIKEERLSSEVALCEFEMEANVLSRVNHPNIIKLLGSGVDPRPFLVLEFLEGGTLAQRVGTRSDWRRGQFFQKSHSMGEALREANSLACALHYLHSEWSPHMSIIHRDIKPDNIGYTADGTLKLFDFGLSTCIRSSHSHECYKMTGNTGTLRYMAPEVARGLPYNSSVDVYSFAMIFWQLLSGRVPFLRLGKSAFLKSVVEGGQRPALDSRWPPALKQLLARCWDADNSVRLDSQAVLQELVGLMNEESKQQFKRMSHSSMSLRSGSLVSSSVKDAFCGRLLCSRTSSTIKSAFLLSSSVVFLITVSFVIASSGADVVAGALLLVSSTALYSVALSYEPQLRQWRLFGGASPSLLKAAQSSKHLPVSASDLSVSSTHSADRDDPECGLNLSSAGSRKIPAEAAALGNPVFNPLTTISR